jgi:hypothetical protein
MKKAILHFFLVLLILGLGFGTGILTGRLARGRAPMPQSTDAAPAHNWRLT